MPAREDKTPAVRPEEHDSDSDEAPEVVTKQSAAEQAQTQRQKEKEARTQAKEAAKRWVLRVIGLVVRAGVIRGAPVLCNDG
jgi:hypothetical protein